MRYAYVILFVVLSAAFLLLISPFIGSPLLYSVENGSSTLYHTNPAAAEMASEEYDGDMLLLMQDILDASQPVVLNIKLHNFEEANLAFEEYKEISQQFSNLVVTLDLSESDIGAFDRENEQNLKLMNRILNESEQFEEVNRLEIKYRDSADPSLVYTLSLEGEALHSSIAQTSDDYQQQSPSMIEVSEQLELDTKGYQDSVAMLEEVVADEEKAQGQRSNQGPPTMRSGVVIAIIPDSGRYGDVVNISGTLPPEQAGELVSIVLDTVPWMEVHAGGEGAFELPVTLETLRPGRHFLYARAGGLSSNVTDFSVLPSSTHLTLNVSRGEQRCDAVCTGRLMAGTGPVRNASVSVCVDGEEEAVNLTSSTGSYAAEVSLPAGVHRVQAFFDGDGFPLNASSSEVEEISTGDMGNAHIKIAIGGGILLFLAMGGIYRLRRRTQPSGGAVNPVRTISEASAAGEEVHQPAAPLPTPGEIFEIYRMKLETGAWNDAVLLLYRSLVECIAAASGLHNPLVCTPGEIAGTLFEDPIYEPFAAFVAQYELIRYGGIIPPTGEDPLIALYTTVIHMLEERADADD
jgi:hypothetical protein